MARTSKSGAIKPAFRASWRQIDKRSAIEERHPSMARRQPGNFMGL
jgi:hypothetical protein